MRVCVSRKNDSFEASIKTSCSQATTRCVCVCAFVFAEREGGAGADSTAVHGMVGHHTLRQTQQYSALCDDWKLPTTRDGSWDAIFRRPCPKETTGVPSFLHTQPHAPRTALTARHNPHHKPPQPSIVVFCHLSSFPRSQHGCGTFRPQRQSSTGRQHALLSHLQPTYFPPIPTYRLRRTPLPSLQPLPHAMLTSYAVFLVEDPEATGAWATSSGV